MSPTKKILIGLGVAVVLLIAVAALVGGGEEGVAVETSEARVRSITETVTAAGTVASEVEVVVSSDVSGEIVTLAVQEGDAVRAGQLLLRVRPDIYASQAEQAQTQVAAAQSGVGEARGSVAEAEQAVVQARADVAQATADRERAERAYRRQQDLFDRDVVSAADLEAARGAFEVARASEQSARERVGGAEARVATSRGRVRSAQAQAQGAQAQARQARQQLAQTSIFAPISGTVSQLNVELGERVVGTAQMSGTELMRIARLDEMTLESDVNENDVVRVQAGDSARVTVDAYPDEALIGTVVEIANSARVENAGTAQATTNFPVVVRLTGFGSNEGGAGRRAPDEGGAVPTLRPGMSGQVDIFTRTVANAVVVPIQAVTVRDFNEAERERRRRAEASGEDVPDGPVPDGEDLRRVVFVVEDGRAVMREVETGISDATHIEVRRGLEGGETVISGPFRLLRTEIADGDAVREGEVGEVGDE